MPELTSVSTVRSYIGDTSIDSTLLTTFITAAEAQIARWCNRYDETEQGNHWLSSSRVEFMDGFNSDHVMLKHTPVSAVSAVVWVLASGSTQAMTLTDLTLDGREIADLGATTPGRTGKLAWRYGAIPTVYEFDNGLGVPDVPAPGWPWTPSPSGFGGGPQRIKVSYTGGFASAPADLAMAATQLAAQMYRDRGKDGNLQSERLGDYQYVNAGAADRYAGIGSIEAAISAHRREVW